MYFNNKNNTNIDNEFNDNNLISNILSIISKYKLIILIVIILFISIPTVLYFVNNDTNILSKEKYEIILSGEDTMTIYKGSEYIEPGYYVSDSKNKDLTNEISITSNVDINTIGEYEIMYSIDNTYKVRKIIVIDKPKEYVYIYLTPVNNSTHIYLKTGDEYQEPGYKAISTSGKDLSSKVKVTGDIDTKTQGTYKLIYSVTDDNGVTTTETRNVIVMNTEISLTLNNQEYTNKEVTINIGVIDNYFDYIILPNGEKILTQSYQYKVTNNGKYTFKVYNKKGNVKEASIEVKNIDKEAPTGSCNGSYSNGKSLINITAKDLSGIDKYVINGTSYTNNRITISSELKSVNINIYDKAGNQKNISCNLDNKNIEQQKPSSSKPNSSSKSNSPSSEIQNKINDNLFIGDSRTVGMCSSYKLCESSIWVAEVGKGYSWFETIAIPSTNNKLNNKQYNIIILMGVNDVGGKESTGKNAANKYYNKIYELASSSWKQQNVIFVSVNPVVDGYSYAYNIAVDSFNNEIKSKIKSSGLNNLKYCDTSRKLNITTSNSKDGLHYDKNTYQQIYNYIKNNCI